jgi:hypothetical protein
MYLMVFVVQLLETVREGVITYASANTRELFYSPATPPPPPPPVEDISSAAEFHKSKNQVNITRRLSHERSQKVIRF